MYTNDSEATSALMSYIWKLLRVNLGWKQSDYNMVPVVPVAQQPEVMMSGKPFLVYGSATAPPRHLYALRGESVSVIIYSTDVDEVTTVSRLLTDTFERQDEAASDVNSWLDKEQALQLAADPTWVRRNISFGTISSALVQNAVPSEQEGGYYSALLILECKYVSGHLAVTNGFSTL